MEKLIKGSKVFLVILSILLVSSMSVTNLKSEELVAPTAIGNTIQEIFPDPNFAQVVADNVSAGDVNAILTEEMIEGFTFLVASSTQISSITGIGHLTSLEVIALDGSQITSVPSEIENLTALTYLNLNFNQLTSLPREIGNLTSLEVLSVGENYLTSLPQEIENIASLVSLEASGNLLPSDAGDYLRSLPSFSNVSISVAPQSKLQLTYTDLEFDIITQQDINDIQNMGSTITNVEGESIPASHIFILDQYIDGNGPVDISDYIQNGKVVKSGTLYAKIRATGEGLFPNNSDNALTDDYIKLNFEATYYNLTFDLNGATGTIPTVQSLMEGTTATEVEQPIRDGYIFKGWNTAQDGSGNTWDFASTTMPAHNVFLYAQWEENVNPITDYTLQFDLNGGRGVIPANQILNEGQKATKPVNPIKAGYIFNGWNTARDGSGQTWDFETNTMPANDVTLYAQWTKTNLPATGDSSNALLNSIVLILAGATLFIISKKRYSK